MLVINHLVGEVILDREDDKLNCWTQSKRVFQDLVRINRNSKIELDLSSHGSGIHFNSYCFFSVSPSSLSSATMKDANQHPSTQAAKPSKTKSKSTTSLVSQKANVEKSSRTKIVWSVKEKSKGEGTGASQQLQKDKVSEGVQNQPSHSVPSQTGTEINKKINTSLLATSQKVSNIEKISQPGTQNKGMDKIQTLPPRPKMFGRRKKPKTSQGAHTVVQSLSTGVTKPILNSTLDAFPTNVEKQPYSLNIPFPIPQSNYFLKLL